MYVRILSVLWRIIVQMFMNRLSFCPYIDVWVGIVRELYIVKKSYINYIYRLEYILILLFYARNVSILCVKKVYALVLRLFEYKYLSRILYACMYLYILSVLLLLCRHHNPDRSNLRNVCSQTNGGRSYAFI